MNDTERSKQTLFVNRYLLVTMGWTYAKYCRYNKDAWNLEIKANYYLAFKRAFKAEPFETCFPKFISERNQKP